MADHPSKIRWEKENVIKVAVKVNKNQDPDLYQSCSDAPEQESPAEDTE